MFLFFNIFIIRPIIGWGPFAHTYFGVNATVTNNITDLQQNDAFLFGLIAIDAFSHTIFGTSESTRPKMHTTEFLGYLMHFVTENQSMSVDKKKIVRDFALGMGCHLFADHVGHYRGYLHSHSFEFAGDWWVRDKYDQVVTDGPLVNIVLIDQLLPILADSTIADNVHMEPVTKNDLETNLHNFRLAFKSEKAVLDAAHLVPLSPEDFMIKTMSCCNDEPTEFLHGIDWSLDACTDWITHFNDHVEGSVTEIQDFIEDVIAREPVVSCTDDDSTGSDVGEFKLHNAAEIMVNHTRPHDRFGQHMLKTVQASPIDSSFTILQNSELEERNEGFDENSNNVATLFMTKNRAEKLNATDMSNIKKSWNWNQDHINQTSQVSKLNESNYENETIPIIEII